MLALLRHKVFRTLYAAQVVSLLGTGLATIALGLLAFEMAGENAGQVLGTALAIKMIAYVSIAPLAQALLGRVSVKKVLISLDFLRTAIVLCLPFVSEIWQIYTLVFLLQAASASFTPSFQAVIPEVLPDEGDYTRALSLSRLTYDIENLISPTMAAALLLLMPFHWLFAGTALGFCASAWFVWVTHLPPQQKTKEAAPFIARMTSGARIYLATPRLRGLLSLNMAAAAGGAMVIVNTVVIIREGYGMSAAQVGIGFAAYGMGSMLAALLLPRVLAKTGDRLPMVFGAILLSFTMFAGAWLFTPLPNFSALLSLWFVAGLAYSTILTPAGRLLQRSAHAEARPALFAAQFALSHACWLLTYPLAGWIGALFGMKVAFLMLGAMAAGSVGLSLWLWPQQTGGVLPHSHADLPAGHPHLKGAQDGTHTHIFVIDDLHRQWPTQG